MPYLVSCVWKSQLALLALSVFSIAFKIWLRKLKICFLCSRNLASPVCPGCWGSSSDFNGQILLSVLSVYRHVFQTAQAITIAKNSSFFCIFTVSAQCGKLFCEVPMLPYEPICRRRKIRYAIDSGTLSKRDTYMCLFSLDLQLSDSQGV